MQKKSEDFSMDQVARMAQSPAGQQLLALLRQQDSARMERATQQLRQGDYAQAGQTLRALLSDPQIASLLRQLEG